MAEQEACTELVARASEEEKEHQSTGKIEGESLLLPLLQGLLEAPEPEQTFDSGTESGEDQRSGLIAEVQTALEKLSASLRSDSTDVTQERRESLLQLVTKLQAGLLNSLNPKPERRASSSSHSGRFQRRKNRHNRHTVGVSQEELAHARRLIEEISLNDLTQSNSENKIILQKQSSESSVTSSANSSYKNLAGKKVVKNSIAKPFTSSNSVSNTSSSVQTPTEPSELLDMLFNEQNSEEQELTYHEPPVVQKKCEDSAKIATESADIRLAYKAVQKAAARKKENSESTQIESETDDDETSTVKEPSVRIENELKENPIYSEPQTVSISSHEEKSNKFNTESKKLKMKRANTIDIPKPLNFYEDEDDSDSSPEDDALKRRNTYYALRGPIRVNTPASKNYMPVLDPKTESDKKFLAFLNKNNENNSNKASVWANNTTVWGNKFGNIKNTFEKTNDVSAKDFWKSADDGRTAKTSQFGPKISRQSARNLQQMFEEKKKQTVNDTSKPTWKEHNHNNSNIVTGSLMLKTEPEKSYKVIPEHMPVNQFSHAPQSAFRPIPKKHVSEVPVMASPLSPTSNEIIKSKIKNDNSGSVFLYSPKPMNHDIQSNITSPPIVVKPWTTNAPEHGGSRVLSLAAAKFENVAPPEPTFRQRKNNNNKVFIPPALKEQDSVTVKFTAPYLAKSTETKGINTVRKLSGQYDNLGSQEQNYYPPQIKPQTYEIKTKVVEKQYTPPVQSVQPQFPYPQNYRIVYDKPVQQKNVAQFKSDYDQTRSNDTNQHHYQPYQMQKQYQTPNYHKNNPSNYVNQTSKQFFQHVPGNEEEAVRNHVEAPKQQQPSQSQQEYVSTYQFNPKISNQTKTVAPNVPKFDRQISSENVKEYTAINSKIMSGPISQQAVTVRQKSPMNRDGHDMEAALSLKNTLQNVNKIESGVKCELKSPSQSFKYKSNNTCLSPTSSFKYPQEMSKPHSPNGSFNFKQSTNNKQRPAFNSFNDIYKDNRNYGIVKPMQQKPTPIYNNVKVPRESLEINSKGQAVLTGQFQIPLINVKSPESPRAPSHTQVLSKSDSWHQICLASQTSGHSPSPSPTNKPVPVMRSKSSHALAVPKLFEAGLSKDEMALKRKTMEAYLRGTKPSEDTAKVVKRSINRIKTSEKVSASSRQPTGGLSRSRTLPDMINPELLDESNVEKAFEDLFKTA